MKKSLLWIVVVYMLSGKIYTYSDAHQAETSGGSSPLVGPDTPANVLLVEDERFRTLAAFPLRNVERWEIK